MVEVRESSRSGGKGLRALRGLSRSPYQLMRFLLNNWRVLLGGYVALLLVSTVVYWAVEDEGASLWDSFWWACITSLTVGYGDYTAASVPGRITGILLVGVTVMGIVPMITALLTQKLVHDENEFTHAEQEEQKRRLENMDRKVDGLLGQNGALRADVRRLNGMVTTLLERGPSR